MIELFTLNPGKSKPYKKKAKKKRKSAKLGPAITGKTSRRNPMARNATYYNPRGRKSAKRSRAAKKGWATRRMRYGYGSNPKGWWGQKKDHQIAAMLGHGRDVSPRKGTKVFKEYEYPRVTQTDFFRYRDRHPFSKPAWKRVHKRRKRAGKKGGRTPWIRVAGKRTKYAANPRRGSGAAGYRHLTKYFARHMGGRAGFKKAGVEWRKLSRHGAPTMAEVRRLFPLSGRRRAPAKRKKRAANRGRGYRYGMNRKAKKKPTKRRARNYRYKTAAYGPPGANYRYTAAPVLANTRYQLPAAFATNPMEAVMEFPKQTILNVEFMTGTVLPFAGGAIASKIIAAQAASLILGKKKNPERFNKFFGDAGWKKAMWEAGAGVMAGMGIGLATKGEKTDFAMKVAAGGMMAALLTLVETARAAAPIRKLYAGTDGFGQIGQMDVEEELKDQIAAELATELDGFGDYFDVADDTEAVEGELPTLSGPGGAMGAFVTTEELPGEQEQITLDNFGAAPNL